ncbi:MAG: DALR domain-containing protein, partial [Mobilitalea sp.]
VVRFFMLNSHYRSPLNFSKDLVEAAKNSLNRILTSVVQLGYLLENDALKGRTITAQEENLIQEAETLVNKYNDAMDNDFNTSDAIAAIFELVRIANTNCDVDSSEIFVREMNHKIVTACDILGIEAEKKTELLDADIENLIEERQNARKNKNFARSDEIRDLLLEKGILLEDTREGVRWKRN